MTHPIFWTTHPIIFIHYKTKISRFSHSIGTDIHRNPNINIDFSATFEITAILYFLKLEERMRTWLGRKVLNMDIKSVVFGY